MHSVLENDQQIIKEGKIIGEAFNQGLSSFTPDLMFENMVRNFKGAEQIYGQSLLRQLTGYSSEYINRNINIPEFQKELKKQLADTFDKLKEDGLLTNDGITEKGLEVAAIINYVEEIDKLSSKGFGENITKKRALYGDKADFKSFSKSDRYRDIAIKRSVKTAIRRGHEVLDFSDLKSVERTKRGSISLIYAIDASGSMRGKKLEVAKKAGIALSFKAIQEKDKVGLMIFGSEVKTAIHPTTDFKKLLLEITKTKASKETNLSDTLNKSIELFPSINMTKHLILITDALPTVGKKPEEETLEAVSKARTAGITISLIGIDLDKEGRNLAERIVQVGNGKLYVVRDLENIDKIVLQDYYSLH
ncbi:MAG: VWA domain-containing protein [Nanoarchaeota archaeon]|nr:VWA domain-containing protein [Nanoarchaeota archaeon]